MCHFGVPVRRELSKEALPDLPRLFARVGNIKAHQLNMQLLYGLALILTGLFTLLPNRVMGQIFFGG